MSEQVPDWVKPYLKGLDTVESAEKYLKECYRDLREWKSKLEKLEESIEDTERLLPHLEAHYKMLKEASMTPEERERLECIAAVRNPNQMKFQLVG